jgi:hypothetical protein
MPTIEVAQDDLVLIIPQDSRDNSTHVRLLVGDRPIEFLQELSVTVGVMDPAEVKARWPELSPSAISTFPTDTPARILASQTLMAPWLTWYPAVERQRPTLWERLEEPP